MPTEEELAEAKLQAETKEQIAKIAKEEEEGKSKKELTASEKWEAYLETLDDDTKELYSGHIHGLKSALQKEREASKGLGKAEKRLAELEEAENKRKEAEMTEVELLKKRAEDAEAAKLKTEQSFNLTRLKFAVKDSAMKLGFEDPEDAYTMTKAKMEKLEISEDGTVEGALEILEELIEAKPYLLKKVEEKEKEKSLGTPKGGKKVSSGGDKEVEKVKLPVPF